MEVNVTTDDSEDNGSQPLTPRSPAPPTSSGYALLTTNEVAKILRRSPASVRTLAKNRQLPAHPAFPSKLLFRWTDVARFISGAG